jgi:ABC-type dipeptide/oligopeptide/nickel transport system permease subunit
MNQSLILLLCLSPLATIFIIIKFVVWISETKSFRSETEKLKRMQYGPYEVWDEEEELDEW